MMTAGVARRPGAPGASEVDAILALARTTGDDDGVEPLSEQAVLHLRAADAAPTHLFARTPEGELAGYAQVDATDAVAGPAAELFVHPRYRRRGLGRALLAAALDTAGAAALDTAGAAALDTAGAAAPARDPGPGAADAGGGTPTGRRSPARLRVWAHGDHPAAGALAREFGFTRDRVLWQMRRPLSATLPERPLPIGVTVRAFRPGADDDEWLAVNARAFADHPEQGRWTAADLRLRMAEPWFDPTGFLLAVDPSGRLVGFHWTKVHPADHRRDAIGEVYVLGVDPAAHGRGLGAALTLAGLRHLRGRGLTRAMLYVDEANRTAVALYDKLGFTRWSTDVSYGNRR